MGEYVSIDIKRKSLLWFKNKIEKRLAAVIFSNRDLIIKHNVKYDENDTEELPHTQYIFVTNVGNAKNRLDVLGYSIDRFKEIFDRDKKQIIDCYDYFSHKNIDIEYDEKKLNEKVDSITFTKWKNAINRIAKYELEYGDITSFSKDKIKFSNDCDRIIYYSIKDDWPDSYYGLFEKEINPFFTIRVILDNCDDSDEITFDVTNLVEGGWVLPEDIYFCKEIDKNIVLVEGSSDKEILEFALFHIYPHLYDLIYFMDFEYAENQRRVGGIESISNNIKTFIASKLDRNFIAVYDNDTAGHIAKKNLLDSIKNIPSNIRLLNYPDIDEAKKYPTLSPNGTIVFDNINCRACSIELYLPDNMLKKGDNYELILWKSLIEIKNEGEILYAYQGVIEDKSRIKRRFVKYKNSVEKKQKAFCVAEWQKMQKILDLILFAFK